MRMHILSIESLFRAANRQSGAWLPEVQMCLNRATPCGNPACADEAMHAQQLRAGNPGDALTAVQAEHAEAQAHRVARHCGAAVGSCPIEQATGINRHDALAILSGR